MPASQSHSDAEAALLRRLELAGQFTHYADPLASQVDQVLSQSASHCPEVTPDRYLPASQSHSDAEAALLRRVELAGQFMHCDEPLASQEPQVLSQSASHFPGSTPDRYFPSLQSHDDAAAALLLRTELVGQFTHCEGPLASQVYQVISQELHVP